MTPTAAATLGAAQTAAAQNLITGWLYVSGVGPVTGEADADLAWQKSYAGADATYAVNDAGNSQQLAINLAGDQQTYDGTVAQAVQTQSNSYAGPGGHAGPGWQRGLSGYWDAQTAAANWLATQRATAMDGWQGAVLVQRTLITQGAEERTP